MTGPQALREAFVKGAKYAWDERRNPIRSAHAMAEAWAIYPDPPQAVMASGNPVETRSFPGATFHRDQTERLAKPTPQASESSTPVMSNATMYTVEPVKEE
jgi:hypothetical protein